MEALLFSAALVAIAEIGDKTQLLSLLLANVPVVLAGEWLTRRIPLRAIRIVAASLFAVMGAMTLLKIGF